MSTFITIEGIDGAGKSTVIEGLKNIYTDNILFIRTPGQTEAGKKIREIVLDKELELAPESLLLLYLADMITTSKLVVEPALREGKTVICDRWWMSTYCYQYDMKEHLLPYLSCLAVPDLVIHLAVTPEVAAKRIENKEPDRFESQGLDFLRQIQTRYKEVFSLPILGGKVKRVSSYHPPDKVLSLVKDCIEIGYAHRQYPNKE